MLVYGCINAADNCMRLVVTVKYGRSLRRVTQQRFYACIATVIKASAGEHRQFPDHGHDLTGLLWLRSIPM